MADQPCTVTQYVGSRYVPLFAEPLDWTNDRSYEPLTIVYYQGNSYTSRQYVPTGIDISNEGYWALTGNYNAQIEQYREEVKRVDERITSVEEIAENAGKTAESAVSTANAASSTAQAAQSAASGAVSTANSANTTAQSANTTAQAANTTANNALTVANEAKNRTFKKMLFIGDSWGAGYYGGSDHPTAGIAQQLANALNINTLVNLSVAAVGWSYTGSGGRNFYQQYTNATSEQKQDVDLIVICGGQNDDHESDLTNIWSQANGLFSAIAEGNPNAEVHVFPFPFSYGRTFGNLNTATNLDNPILARCYAEVDKAINNTVNKNVHVHKGCHRWGYKLGTIDESYIDDAWHLSAAGYARFAGIMARLITEGGDYWPTMMANVTDYTAPGTVRSDKVYEENGVIHVELYINATGNNPIGTNFRLPGWCLGADAKYFAGVSNGSSGMFMSMNNHNDGVDSYVEMSIQGAALEANQWLFLNWSWPAGF